MHSLGGATEYYFCGINARAIYLKLEYVILIILLPFSASSSENRYDERTQYIIGDLLFLKHHTRNICSIRDTIKDQYYNTENDDDFIQNESK